MALRNLSIVAGVAVLALLATSCQKLQSRDQLNKGVQAYKNAQYPQAVENFKKAVELDPKFPKVLSQDPKNDVAIASIASLFYNQKKFDDAKQWYEKLVAANPNNKEAYYTLGVITWSKFYPVYGAARAKLGMKPEEPGPIKDKKVKEELKAQW